jgi:hypothetical protein
MGTATPWFIRVSHSHFLPFICYYNTSLLFCSLPICHPFLLLSSNPLPSSSLALPADVFSMRSLCINMCYSPANKIRSHSNAWIRNSHRKAEDVNSGVSFLSEQDAGLRPAFMCGPCWMSSFLPDRFVKSLPTGKDSHSQRMVDIQVPKKFVTIWVWSWRGLFVRRN